jgi:HEAT repeat protein
LNDRDPQARLYAITCLGRFRAEAFLEQLKALTNDPDEAVRDAARYAVSRIQADR